MKDRERRATRIKQAMAYNRETFKNRLGEYLSGALGEFYKSRLAEKNGHTKWVQHWRTESDRLIISFGYALAYEIRGFKDRRKALNEVVTYLQSRDSSYRRMATGQILRDYKITRIAAPIDDEDTETFWVQALSHADFILESM